jgi:trigger factor
MTSLTTSVEPLDDNKVRVSVTVPAAEFEKAVDSAFRKLASEVKIPGFRPGKAPRRLLEARFGVEYAREQALRDSLPGYYEEAIVAESIDAIAMPEIDITSGADGGDVAFDAVVEIRPVVAIAGYLGLEVKMPAPDVSEEAIDAQIEALRDRFADLADSDDPLVDGSFGLIDIKAFDGDEVIDNLSATDFLYEVGSGLLVEELDVQLRGARPGAILKFDATLSERFGEHAGRVVTFSVIVKEVKRKVLPDVDDDWVSEVSEFDAVADLRADIATRLSLIAKVQAQMLVRDKVLEATAALVDIDVPDALVTSEMERRLHDLAHRLEAQGLTIPQYLEATGQEQEPFVAALREGATAAVRADLALRAVVTQEAIVVDDAEIDAEIERLASRLEQKPARVRKDLEQRGAIDALRSDLARGKALRFLVDHADVVDEEGNPVDLSLPEGETSEAVPAAATGGDNAETVPQPAEAPDAEEPQE